MTGIIKKQLILPLLILFLGLFFTSKANAASLANVSDTITTSRPSASAPLNVNQLTTDTSATVVDNGSIYLASDSAVLQADTGQTQNIMTVASMSAQLAGPLRNVYFTSSPANTHHKGTALVVPVTATHTIRLTTVSAIPSGGHIVITFPGSGVNTASPSATTFAFNGLTSANASTYIQTNNATTCTWTITAPSIDCVTSASIAGATTITFLIGCTTGTTSCTAFSPRLINPTKTAAAGTADTWKITVKTQDASAIDLDSAKAVVGTVEAVQVQGTVDAFLTFTIAGQGGTVCSDATNAGITATATFVDLGALSTNISISAQRLTVTTNGAAGYSIIATSSGRFINPASGFWLADANGGNGLTANDTANFSTTPAPGAITAGTPAFGIHPCPVTGGSYTPTVNSTGWGTGGGASNKYANPWNTGTNGFYAYISSYPGPAGTSQTDVEYAATVASTTPAGVYSNYFTYVATPVF